VTVLTHSQGKPQFDEFSFQNAPLLHRKNLGFLPPYEMAMTSQIERDGNNVIPWPAFCLTLLFLGFLMGPNY